MTLHPTESSLHTLDPVAEACRAGASDSERLPGYLDESTIPASWFELITWMVDLRAYHLIVVNTSGGKDSTETMGAIARQAKKQGVLDRVVALHCIVGEAEWPEAEDFARAQAAHYGITRFVVSQAKVGSFLDRVRQRWSNMLRNGKNGPPWPSKAARWCTSDLKRGPAGVAYTRLVKELGTRPKSAGPVRILECLGHRRQESAARKKMDAFERNERHSSGVRTVDTLRPILEWKVEDVWTRANRDRAPIHWAYWLVGMPRLSCTFCFFAGKELIRRAMRWNPELARKYQALERETGYTLTAKWGLVDLEPETEEEAARRLGDFED